MNVSIWPFYSQYDRAKGQHRLNTCGAAKQLSFLARRLEEELGAHVHVATPSLTDMFSHPLRVHVPAQNPVQRMHWDTAAIAAVCSNADIIVCNHEFLAIPCRAMYPKVKLIQMCSVDQDSPLFKVAWDAADLVVAQGQHAREEIAKHTSTPVVTWELAYDEANFASRPAVARDIDVLFVNRCSATNYTHHEEFLQCDFSDLNVVFTDVTNYLRLQRPDLKYCTADSYLDTLHRSKVAIALNDNMYGGLSIREAARAGCTIVCLDAPCYRELVGAHLTTLSNIEASVRAALRRPRQVDVSHASYQRGWEVAKKNFENRS